MKKVYLAGQPNQYDPWRKQFENIQGFDFYDPDTDSDQSSPDTFFPQDLQAIYDSEILIAYPGTKPSEGTWIEVGYFLALNTETPGDRCKTLIIIWPDEREPKWSIEFPRRAGTLVDTVEEAVIELKKLK
ncbi:hypothetical protein GF360_01790 [candidate division WWE3 bacterium]|nr:hypothetical protein [candidate division WWE3 bacterium]